MNAKQRRIYKRYISRELEGLISKGVDLKLSGCYEYDLPNVSQKLYIDYPDSGDVDSSYIYVSLPFAHLLNKKFLNGRYVMLFDSTSTTEELSDISFLKKMSLEDVFNSQVNRNHYPKFSYENDEVQYVFYADQGKLEIVEVVDSDTKSVTFEKVFSDERLPVEVRRELAFNIDMFKKDQDAV